MSLDENAVMGKVDVTPSDVNSAPVHLQELRDTAVSSSSRIADILRHSTQLFSGSLPVAATVNTVLYQTLVCPSTLLTNSTPRLSVISSLFKQWKGDIHMDFRLTKTIYADFKLLFAFVPGATMEEVNSMEISELFAQEYKQVVNACNLDVFGFDIPFISQNIWQERFQPSGIFTIRVYSPIVVAVTSTPFIPFTVEVCASRNNDFGLRYLTGTNLVKSVASATFNIIKSPDVADSPDPNDLIGSNQRENILTIAAVNRESMLANLNSTYPVYGYVDNDALYDQGSIDPPKPYLMNATDRFAKLIARRHILDNTRFLLVNGFVVGEPLKISGVALPAFKDAFQHGARLCIDPTKRENAIISSAQTLSYFHITGLTFETYVPITANVTGTCVINFRLTTSRNITMNFTSTMSRVTSQPSLNGQGLTYFSCVAVSAGRSIFKTYLNFPTMQVSHTTGVTADMNFIGPLFFHTNANDQQFPYYLDVSINNIVLGNAITSPFLPLVPKLRNEMQLALTTHPLVVTYFTCGIDQAQYQVATWTDSGSYSHSENLCFNTNPDNATRPERRSTTDSSLSKFIHTIMDVLLDGKVIGDIINIAGSILSFFGPLVASDGDIYIDLSNPSKLVTYRYNEDKTILANNNAITSSEFVKGINLIRETQKETITPYILFSNSQYKANMKGSDTSLSRMPPKIMDYNLSNLTNVAAT